MDQANGDRGYRLVATLIYDAALISAFFKFPGIWETFAEDGLEKYEPDFEKCAYLGFFHENRLFGIYIIEIHSMASVNLHIALMKEYRSKFLKKSALMTLKFIIDRSPGMAKVNAGVPVIYKHLYRFCKQLGFKDEGLNRESFFKNGKNNDVHILGLVRSEIEEITHERCG